MKFEGYTDYGGFFLQDPSIETGNISPFDGLVVSVSGWEIYATRNTITFAALDKCIPVTVEMNLFEHSPALDNFDHWVIITEMSLELTSNSILLTTITEGPEDPFDTFLINEETYGLRVYLKPIENTKEDSAYYSGELIFGQINYLNQKFYIKVTQI